MKRVHLIISGDVAGVGYRSWAKRHARDVHLVGWIKNREDRTVEVLAEGTEEALNAFIVICKKGPDVSWVENVNSEWLPATGEFIDFTVLY